MRVGKNIKLQGTLYTPEIDSRFMALYVRYNKKTYRIDGIDWTLNPESRFDCGGTSKSYLSYYQVHESH